MLSQLFTLLSRLKSPKPSQTESLKLSESSVSSPAQSQELLSNLNWSKYPNFKESEFACKHCGKSEMNPIFMGKLQHLRNVYGKPMVITSGYRCQDHPIEVAKDKPGAHSTGQACDVSCDSQDAYKLLKVAFELGFTGIGVNQKGNGRFIHLDTLTQSPRPNVWTY